MTKRIKSFIQWFLPEKEEEDHERPTMPIMVTDAEGYAVPHISTYRALQENADKRKKYYYTEVFSGLKYCYYRGERHEIQS